MITLYRYINYPGLCVAGFIVVDSEVFYTLEPPWRDNKRNVSCIPVGVYNVEFMARSWSGKYKNCYHITNVEDRSEILIHNGNTPEHTKGCVLIGKNHGYLAGKPAVLNSKTALRQFADITDKCFQLRVESWV